MLGKNNLRSKLQKMEQQTQKERFAIRKLTVGAVSVLLGLAFVGMANQTVKADTVPSTDQPEQVENIATDDSGESKVLGHPAYLYDENGNRVGNLILAQNSITKIHGTKIINGRKYYLTTNNHYLAAGNIDGTKRLTNRRSIVYNRYGIKTARRLAKKGQVTTYGSKVKIGRHIYYSLGNNKYVRAANLKH